MKDAAITIPDDVVLLENKKKAGTHGAFAIGLLIFLIAITAGGGILFTFVPLQPLQEDDTVVIECNTHSNLTGSLGNDIAFSSVITQPELDTSLLEHGSTDVLANRHETETEANLANLEEPQTEEPKPKEEQAKTEPEPTQKEPQQQQPEEPKETKEDKKVSEPVSTVNVKDTKTGESLTVSNCGHRTVLEHTNEKGETVTVGAEKKLVEKNGVKITVNQVCILAGIAIGQAIVADLWECKYPAIEVINFKELVDPDTASKQNSVAQMVEILASPISHKVLRISTQVVIQHGLSAPISTPCQALHTLAMAIDQSPAGPQIDAKETAEANAIVEERALNKKASIQGMCSVPAASESTKCIFGGSQALCKTWFCGESVGTCGCHQSAQQEASTVFITTSYKDLCACA